MYFSEISELEVSNIIKSLKVDKVKVSENICIKLINELQGIIVKPLTYVLNFCVKNSVFPEKIKIAIIVPIYKNAGPLGDPSNFRRLSLRPIFSKIFEKCIYERLYNFIDKYHILSSKQFGFRNNRNSEDAIQKLISSLETDNNNKRVVILDLKIAFDTVNFKILLKN